MRIMLNKLFPIHNDYALDHITCFQRAIAICLNTYHPDYGNLLYMFENFIRCYKVIPFHNKSFIELRKYIINEYFKIPYSVIKTSQETFRNIIIKNLKERSLVIAPVNLKSIFYSKDYLENDWEHAFIIKGIDDKKEIYYIFDSTHTDDVQEKNFALLFDVLEQAHDMYNKSFVNRYENSLMCFQPMSRLVETPSNIFKNCLMIYMNELEENPYIEYDKLIELNKFYDNTPADNDELDAQIKVIINLPKCKDVFLNELINNLLSYGYIDGEQFSTLIMKKDILINKWKIAINSVIKSIYKKQVCFSSLEHPKKVEMEIKEIIRNCFKKSVDIQEIIDEVYYTEYAQDIISKKNNKFLFAFNGKNITNNWGHDKSPKIFVNRTVVNGQNFIIKVSVIYNPEKCDFVAGLVLRTSEGDLFFFGIDSEKRINIDCEGVNFSLASENGHFKDVFLKVNIERGKVQFCFKCQERLEWREMYSMNINTEYLEVGFGCKTYNKPKPLNVLYKPVF